MKDPHWDTDDEPARSPEEAEEAEGFDTTEWLREIRREIDEAVREMAEEGLTGPQLISVDQLRAAGALDVPPGWRKSLGGQEERDLFSDLIEDGENLEQQQPAKVEADFVDEVPGP